MLSNSAGLYLVLFAAVMGIAALLAVLVGGGRGQSPPELRAKTARDVQPAEAPDVSTE